MTAEERPPALPGDLRERVLAAALAARAAGRPHPPAPEISPAEAFRRAADALDETLRSLPAADWEKPALRGLDVQRLVGHLIGVEEDVQRGLAGEPVVALAGHVESTQQAADREAGRPAGQTRAQWRQAAERTIGLVTAGDLDAEVAVHGMRIPVSLLLVVRAFELWVHENDIRQAVSMPRSVPDASTLSLMTEVAARLLPHAAARRGLDQPVSLRLVLTGAGGGTWDVLLGQPVAPPQAQAQALTQAQTRAREEILIVTDAVGFCRLVANRLSPARLSPHVAGDAGHAARVLAAASALALD